MKNKLDFHTSNWFADSEEPGATGLFEVPDGKELTPFSKFGMTVKTLELRVYHTLKYHKFGMSSKSEEIIKQLHANFKKHSNKLTEGVKSGKEQLKRMLEVEKLIESDNKKIKALCDKISVKYNGKDKTPRIIKDNNGKFLFKGLDDLLEFAKGCVDKQKKLLIDDTKKGEKQFLGVDESGKAKYDDNKIEKLAKAFTTNKSDPWGNQFIVDFPGNNTVQEYIKKRISKTGKLLKDICKIISSCRKAFYALDIEIQKTLASCKDVDDDISSVESFTKITDDKNNYNKYISQLNTAIDAYNILVNLLGSIAKYRGAMAKLISLYDPRVKSNIKELVDEKLKKQIEIYEKMKSILE